MKAARKLEAVFGGGLLLDFFARRLPSMKKARGSLVVYSPGHLGDILHTVPMLKALRKGKPGSKIIWLVGPWSEALARRYSEFVDEIRVFGPNLPPFTRGKREWRQSLWLQWRLAMALRRDGVDVFIGAGDGVGRFLANTICPRLWIGAGEWRPPRVRPEIQTQFQPYEKDRYEADALAGLLRPMGIEAKADRLVYAVSPEERKAAVDFLKTEGVDSSRPLVVLAPGSGWSGKNWLPERFGAVADDLVRRKRCQIAWVGGAGEQSLVPEARSKNFNWVGKTSLSLLAAVLEQAKLFVGNDGGLLHLAAALDVPTVSIWGPTSPGKWGPRGPLHRQIRKVDRCEGCVYWDYREHCRHDHSCLRAVSVEEVLAAIGEVFRP